MFCRWTPEFNFFARDGIPVCWINQDRPKAKRPKPPISDIKVHKRVRRKVGKVKLRGYIQSGCVKILIRYFSFTKGDQDVHVVYYGTSIGFNDIVWVTKFGLPSVKTLICGTLPTS